MVAKKAFKLKVFLELLFVKVVLEYLKFDKMLKF